MNTALIISNSIIKILSLKGRQVKKWGSLALKTGLVHDGLIREPQAIGAAINELFNSTGIRKERVAVSLAGLSFTYRFLDLPRMKPALLEEAVMRAARKEMSLPLDELYLAWQPVPGESDEQSYFVLGVRRNLVDAAVQTLTIAGIEPYTLELQPLALARAANRRDVIIVSLEPDCFDIVFMADGIPGVIHTIGPRGEGATLEDNIRRLADELTKTAAFYQSSHPASHLTAEIPLLLTGDLASEALTSGLLQAEVEYPVESLIPPVEFPPGLTIASYAAGAGLALNYTSQKTVGRTREGFYDININILSAKYRKSRSRPLPAFQIWLGVFLALALIFLFPLYQTVHNLGTDNAVLEDELRLVTRDLNLANLAAEENTLAVANIQQTANITAILKMTNRSILGDRGSFTRNLEAVTTALPPAACFTSIEISSGRIIIRGETDSVFTVVAYATALEAVPFRDVRISELDEVLSKTDGAANAESPPTESRVISFEITMNN